MDQKPVDDFKIHHSCDGRARVMPRMKIVESAEEENSNIWSDENGLTHETAVIKELLCQWFHSDVVHIIADNSYFASITTPKELKRLGLQFIGVANIATMKYPMAYLQ